MRVDHEDWSGNPEVRKPANGVRVELRRGCGQELLQWYEFVRH